MLTHGVLWVHEVHVTRVRVSGQLAVELPFELRDPQTGSSGLLLQAPSWPTATRPEEAARQGEDPRTSTIMHQPRPHRQ